MVSALAFDNKLTEILFQLAGKSDGDFNLVLWRIMTTSPNLNSSGQKAQIASFIFTSIIIIIQQFRLIQCPPNFSVIQ